jgi:putative DNA primase/helicase
LTGEDTVSGEHKFGQIFPFRYNGKLIFGTNHIPGIKVYDEVYCSRWITIPFGNSVFGKEDSKLTDKLTVPSELSGLLNLALKGLKRLQDTDGKFSYNVKYGLSLFKRQSAPIIAFLEDRCMPSDGYISKKQLVLEYNGWAKENGLPLASMKGFGSTIMDQSIIPVETFYRNLGDSRVEAWAGIEVKN